MKKLQSLYTTADDDLASRRLAKLEQQEYRLAESWVNGRDGSHLRLIPAGQFTMGSAPEELEVARKIDDDGDGFALDDETPQFRLITGAFYVSAYAVTNAQFVRFLNEARPSPTPEQVACWLPHIERIVQPETTTGAYRVEAGFERHPVVHVSWPGAEAYCRWAGLRLPREWEWEKAARGPDGRLFPWGDEWHGDYLQWHREPVARCSPTVPVDAFPEGRSPYDVFQMAGNVDEWCADPYQADAYQHYAHGETHLPETGRGRVLRGGECIGHHALEFRCAMRRAHAPGAVAKACIGFRCACGELKWTRVKPAGSSAHVTLPDATSPAPPPSAGASPEVFTPAA